MRQLILLAFFLPYSLLFSPCTFAEPKPRPTLGSILDPEENAIINKAPSFTNADPFANIDSDLPSLSQTLRWELLLTQKAYGVSQNLRTTSDLITSLNKAIEILCFSELQRTLFFDPNSKTSECATVVKYLSAIDQSNPLLYCAEKGLDSTECRERYDSQITLSKIPLEVLGKNSKSSGDSKASSYSFHSDLDVRLEAEKVTQGIAKIKNEISLLKARKSTTPGEEQDIASKINSQINQLLSLTCLKYRIVVLPTKVAISDKELPRQKQPPKGSMPVRKGSLEDLLQKGPFSESITPSNAKLTKNRFRLVSNSCLDAINYTESIAPQNAGIHCYRDGFTAPTCIDARRKQGAHVETLTGDSGKGEGIERF